MKLKKKKITKRENITNDISEFYIFKTALTVRKYKSIPSSAAF